MLNNIKVARVATVPSFLDSHLREQMKHLSSAGFQVSAVSSIAGDWLRLQNEKELECIRLNITRKISPIRDIISLAKLYWLFKTNKFDIVHSTTPKAGLLCAIAGWLARTPVRLHTFTGQVWATKKGRLRALLIFLDKLIVHLNTQCYTDSNSQLQFLLDQGIGNKSPLKVLAHGSLAGVNLDQFNRQKWKNGNTELRNELSISHNDFVLIFVGRLSKEKGIFELIQAYKKLKKRYNELHLILAGPCEEVATQQALKLWESISNLHYIGHTGTPEKYLSISNLLCLPSYREGFGTVVIEAAAMAVPTVGTNITGLNDAIVNGVTGLQVEPNDAFSLELAIDKLIKDRALCERLGQQALERCQNNFNASHISESLTKEYNYLIKRY